MAQITQAAKKVLERLHHAAMNACVFLQSSWHHLQKNFKKSQYVDRFLTHLPKYSGYVFIIIAGLLLAGHYIQKSNKSYQVALDKYRAASQLTMQTAEISMKRSFEHIYENIRTIAALPSVRSIDRHGNNIDADARTSIQQIYNNLANAIDVAEVYIVPVDFDPESVDRTTGKHEEPILMFDSLITDRSQLSKIEVEDAPGSVAKERLDEVEIHEYRQLVNHMTWLKRHYPAARSIIGLEVPILSGSQVITCDNTEFRVSLDDADRMGLMFSVPFYGKNGALKGAITAIIRTNSLRRLLPSKNFMLTNVSTQVFAGSMNGGQNLSSMKWAQRNMADPDLLWSSVTALEFEDGAGPWRIWGGRPNSDFLRSPELVSIKNDRLFGMMLAVAMTIIALLVWNFIQCSRERELSQWRELSDATIEGLIICKGESIVSCNSSLANLLKQPVSLLEGKELSHFIKDPYLRERLLQGEGYQTNSEIELDGQQDCLPVEVVSRPINYQGQTHYSLAVRDLRERKKSQETIEYLAKHDPLTGLANRRKFLEALELVLGRDETNEELAVLYLSLDKFKAINDTLGHIVGDALLQAVAGRLQGCVRESDIVARFGGDEFAIVQETGAQPETSQALADRLVTTLSSPYRINGHEVKVGVSLGIVVAPEDGDKSSDFLVRADLALQHAKSDERRKWCLFTPEMDVAMKARRSLEHDLRTALEFNQFEVFYQKIIKTTSRSVCACEALLRWHHPERGMVSPIDFIPVAEEMGLMGEIGAWVLKQACRDAVKWPQDIAVAVNISAAQIQNGALDEDVKLALASSGLDPSRLELEITESILLHDTAQTIQALHDLRDLGVRIAMDDFGTGYSSLSYFSSFPFDKIKIDRSFVTGRAADPKSRAIVRAVVGLGGALGMETTGEGVETEEDLESLRALGCSQAQGYLFSKPVSVKDLGILSEPRGMACHNAITVS